MSPDHPNTSSNLCQVMAYCNICRRLFTTAQALQQHVEDSPVHAPSFDCNTCDRSYGSQDALDQHLRDSPVHHRLDETSLSQFFLSFPSFAYDPSLSPAESYARLREHQGWRRGQTDADDAWDRYQTTLRGELELWFGAEDDLVAWHTLCRAIRIKPLPTTCKQCKKVGVFNLLWSIRAKLIVMNTRLFGADMSTWST